MDTVDLVVIGAGVAGMAAAYAAQEKGLSTIIIEKTMPGGKLFSYPTIRPNQGIDTISSIDFASQWNEKLSNASLNITYGEVVSVDFKDAFFHIQLTDMDIRAKSLIIATGYRDKPLMIEGADLFLGQGLSYCAACDGSFFKGKKIAVLLDDFSNLEEVIHLQKMTNTLTILTIPSKEKLQPSTLEFFEKLNDVDRYYGVTPVALKGNQRVETLSFLHQGLEKNIQISALFPMLGMLANSECVVDLLPLAKDGFIVTDAHHQTKVPLLFAIGDIQVTSPRLLKSAIEQGNQVIDTLINTLKGFQRR